MVQSTNQKNVLKRRELIDGLHSAIFQLGGSVVSPITQTKTLRIEAPKGSDIPERLAASGWTIIHVGTSERLMTTSVEQIKNGRGEVIRTVSHAGPGIVDVFMLDLGPDK